MSYQQGGSVIVQTGVRRERWPGGYNGGFPVRSVPLVYPSQQVVPDQPVLHMEQITTHGNVSRTEIVPSGMYGQIVDITWRGGVMIEGRAAVLRGVIGVGNQVVGVLSIVRSETLSRQLPQLPAGAILVVPGPLDFVMLRQAITAGVTGIIAGSVPLRDFEGFLRTDLIRLIDSVAVEQAQAYLPAMTILLTEGLGTKPMSASIFRALSQYHDMLVLLSGVTAVRQGIFPELIISLPTSGDMRQYVHPVQTELALGTQVRVNSGEHEGVIGWIDYFFTYEQLFPSGIRSRAIRLRLEDGSFLVIPVTLAQRIG